MSNNISIRQNIFFKSICSVYIKHKKIFSYKKLKEDEILLFPYCDIIPYQKHIVISTQELNDLFNFIIDYEQ